MPQTLIEKIISAHVGHTVHAGDIEDIAIDARIARDFGGANVVKNLQRFGLKVADPNKTFFTFDTNPGGSDQRYAANQHFCRSFARQNGINVFDIDQGIGTHLAIDQGFCTPGQTLVSTDSHANILGAIGAFGQGMGDKDIAHAFATGKVWFKVPPTLKVILKGTPGPWTMAKDIVLAMLRHFGAHGLLGYAVEMDGDILPSLSLDARITMASMATEMGGIIMLFPPNQAVLEHCAHASGKPVRPLYADPQAPYVKVVQLDIEGLEPLISKPGHPEDVTEVANLQGTPIDSVFVGSCTNGRLEDLHKVAEVLKGRKVAPHVVLKVVPTTDKIWVKALLDGTLKTLKEAGALVSNAGCAGCAAGQVGQNGPGEVTVSTGNRNYAGKQGQGQVFLASPWTAAASAIAGVITHPKKIPDQPVSISFASKLIDQTDTTKLKVLRDVADKEQKPTLIKGRVWIIEKDNIDTDMIFHNRHLAVTELSEMGQFAFGNLKGWEDFPSKAQKGDIVITGQNFGAGSSRQQAVDCFIALGIGCIIAQSFGAIYERNAINAGFPIVVGNLLDPSLGLKNGDLIQVHLLNGLVTLPDGREVSVQPFSKVQFDIYQRGGLLFS